jgi:hypothetical protein
MLYYELPESGFMQWELVFRDWLIKLLASNTRSQMGVVVDYFTKIANFNILKDDAKIALNLGLIVAKDIWN